MAEIAYLPGPEPASELVRLRRSVRATVTVPEYKQVDRDIPIPPRLTGLRASYPWFRDVRRIGWSFHADTAEEARAFRLFCGRRGWRAEIRVEGDGWRCWRIQ